MAVTRPRLRLWRDRADPVRLLHHLSVTAVLEASKSPSANGTASRGVVAAPKDLILGHPFGPPPLNNHPPLESPTYSLGISTFGLAPRMGNLGNSHQVRSEFTFPWIYNVWRQGGLLEITPKDIFLKNIFRRTKVCLSESCRRGSGGYMRGRLPGPSRVVGRSACHPRRRSPLSHGGFLGGLLPCQGGTVRGRHLHARVRSP